MSVLLKAIRNNAEWCELVCGFHNAKGEFQNNFWINKHHVPLYYPNLITLNDKVTLDTVKNAMPKNLENFSVKDSFDILDLSGLNFVKIIESEWICAVGQTSSYSKWTVVDNENDLANWARAWDVEHQKLFAPDILQFDNVKIIAIYKAEKIVAGAIANYNAGVVGLSNIFCSEEKAVPVWETIVSATRTLFPSIKIVGYEGGDELMAAEQAGFKKMGPLSVWAKE